MTAKALIKRLRRHSYNKNKSDMQLDGLQAAARIEKQALQIERLTTDLAEAKALLSKLLLVY